MGIVRAVMVDPEAPGRLALREVEPPTPGRAEALVRVAAISLNRGEVRGAMAAQAGYRPGWDLAGVVEQAAADGSGPPAGARVVGLLRSGAWAEVVAVPTDALAVLPEGVSLVQAATLPVAGLTALHAVGRGGELLARRVLVTGASGGVGHFACQLARLAGAHVVGVVRQASHEAVVREAGANDVVVSEDGAAAAVRGPYGLVVDSVGGPVLGNALGMLAPGGVCVNFGVTAAPEVTFNAQRFYGTGSVTLYGLRVFDEVRRESAAVGLGRLLALLAAEQLRPHIEVQVPWTEIASVARQLLDRRYGGKAVLLVGEAAANDDTDVVTEASIESFPASDPPGWISEHV